MNPAPALSPPRVAANLAHAFGGVWRLTLRRFLQPGHWLTLAIGLGVLALLSFAPGPRGSGTGHFVGWVGGFHVTFLVPAIAFMAAAGALRDEMKSGAVDYVLTRPIPRPAFVAFKFLAHTVCLQVEFLLALAVVFGVGALRDAPGLAAALPSLLLAQGLLVVAFGALGFLCAAITTRYFLIGLAYAGVIEAGVGQIPTQLSRLSMTHLVRDFLAPLMERSAAPSAGAPGGLFTAAVLIAFSVLVLAAATAIFSTRELSGPAEA